MSFCGWSILELLIGSFMLAFLVLDVRKIRESRQKPNKQQAMSLFLHGLIGFVVVLCALVSLFAPDSCKDAGTAVGILLALTFTRAVASYILERRNSAAAASSSQAGGAGGLFRSILSGGSRSGSSASSAQYALVNQSDFEGEMDDEFSSTRGANSNDRRILIGNSKGGRV